jgi:hypothetical protein
MISAQHYKKAMKRTAKTINNGNREHLPAKPLKKEGQMPDTTEQRKKKGSWAGVSDLEDEREKADNSKVKKS